MNYSQTTEYLFSAMPSFQNVGGDAYKPGLERIESFCNLLGNPHKRYPVVHIAGTNGKGSTSHMLAAVLQSAGYRVALFTSPHLKDFRERMRVDGAMISEAEVVDFVAKHRAKMEEIGLSFFEMTAAMAFDFFARSQVDIAIIETGLGGRLDATNIVEPLLSLITNIDIDHTQYLGDTLAKIAAEKAGIIKQGGVAIIGDRGSDKEVSAVFEAKAKQQGAKLIFAQELYDVDSDFVQGFELDLLGDYQRKNLVAVLAVIDNIKLDVSAENIRTGLSRVGELTGLRGRWQVVDREPLTICDTGHNVHGLTQVTAQLKCLMESKNGDSRLICVLGFARDKDLLQILNMFPHDAQYIFVRAAVERAFTVDEIGSIARNIGLSFELIQGEKSVERGVATARQMAKSEDVIFVGGSTFVVAEL
ncbi:MAG: folylpolyglutamate synthase/dihydrofolate synthase family protein [Rikenellaceae bacterium]